LSASWVLEGRGGEEKGLWRGKPLFASFKKTRERFWGVLKGFICPILKFPKLGGFGGLNTQIDNFVLVIIQNFNFRHDRIITIFFSKTTYSKQLIFTKQLNTISFSKTTYSKKLIYPKQLIKNSS